MAFAIRKECDASSHIYQIMEEEGNSDIKKQSAIKQYLTQNTNIYKNK
jgi:hypothetical protein